METEADYAAWLHTLEGVDRLLAIRRRELDELERRLTGLRERERIHLAMLIRCRTALEDILMPHDGVGLSREEGHGS